MKLVEKEDEKLMCVMRHGNAELLKPGFHGCGNHLRPEWAALNNFNFVTPERSDKFGVGGDEASFLRRLGMF